MGYSPTLQRRPSTLRLHPPPADSQGDAHPLVDSRQVMVQPTAGSALCDGDGQTTLWWPLRPPDWLDGDRARPIAYATAALDVCDWLLAASRHGATQLLLPTVFWLRARDVVWNGKNVTLHLFRSNSEKLHGLTQNRDVKKSKPWLATGYTCTSSQSTTKKAKYQIRVQKLTNLEGPRCFGCIFVKADWDWLMCAAHMTRQRRSRERLRLLLFAGLACSSPHRAVLVWKHRRTQSVHTNSSSDGKEVQWKVLFCLESCSGEEDCCGCNITGNIICNITGNVIFTVTGNDICNIIGNRLCDLTENVISNITGNSLCRFAGSFVCNITGNVICNTTGSSICDIAGNSMCDITGNSICDITGNGICNITGKRYLWYHRQWYLWHHRKRHLWYHRKQHLQSYRKK